MLRTLDKIIKQTILEYSSMKRLPFEEDEFKNKNYIEQYTDWLEDFGRYGTLPPSTLDFWEEIKKAIQIIIEKDLRNHVGLGLSDNPDEILSSLKDIIGNDIQIIKGNKVYVERAVKITNYSTTYNSSDSQGNDPQKLYNRLVKRYNHNVGGCWSYKQDGAESYCSLVVGDTVLLKGYIRVDDIDFVKTVLLNFHYPEEHEIRVKPNTKVELFEVLFDCKYKAPLRGNLIVSATYFGNNGKYNGDYAPVDDGFGRYTYMDRKGNIYTLTNVINNMLANNENISQVVDSIEKISDKLYKITVDDKVIDKVNIINIKDRKLISDDWFYYISDFHDGFARVKRTDNKYSLIDKDGQLIGNGKLWFDFIGGFINGFAEVQKDEDEFIKSTLINKNGELIGNGKLWFDFISKFSNGFARVQRDDDKWSYINTDGELIGDGNLWFDEAYDFVKNIALVSYNNTKYIIDSNGNFYSANKDMTPIPNPIQENRNIKRQVIRLTENDLHEIIENSIKHIINIY